MKEFEQLLKGNETTAEIEELILRLSEYNENFSGKCPVENIQYFSMESVEEINLFSGSFYPWHEGHTECLRQVQGVIPTVVVPDVNPQKSHVDKDILSELRLILEKIKSLHNVYIYPRFLTYRESNPSASWIPKLACKKKNFVIGADNLFGIENWIDSKKLLGSLNKVVVVPREFNMEKMQIKAAELSRSYSNLTVEILSHHHYENLSSSSIRESRRL